MNIRFHELQVTTKKTIEVFKFSSHVTFLHGPIGAGKSSVARLIDFCFGGDLVRTPAIQRGFVSARLLMDIGVNRVQLERGEADLNLVRVSWEEPGGELGSINAPIDAGPTPIMRGEVWNLSDLIFSFSGIEPIKVRRSKRDPNSPVVRLSIRDLLWYCYLKQDKLDGSFYRLDDTFKKYKSMDAMRFITGLHSERLSELESRLAATVDAQRSKRDAVFQLRQFLEQFHLGTEIDLAAQVEKARKELATAETDRESLDRDHASSTHVVEPLRDELRQLSSQIDDQRTALAVLRGRVKDQTSLKSDLITAKVKASRVETASSLLGRVKFVRCPACGSDVRPPAAETADNCHLCGTARTTTPRSAAETEVLQRDLSARIDDLSDSIERHQRELNRAEKALALVLERKAKKDAELSSELARYDSTFVAAARAADRKVATLQERISSLERLAELPEAIMELERTAGELQGEIDTLKSAIEEERSRLKSADSNIRALEDKFLDVLLAVGFPGVSPEDAVEIDPRTWDPKVIHGREREVVWGFFDAGSGGKKTLFNVCYALALHELARERNLPLPNFLIIDSPSKNFGREINRPLAMAMFKYAYKLVAAGKPVTQILLIDSDFVPPEDPTVPVIERLMVPGDAEHPPLISYYTGP